MQRPVRRNHADHRRKLDAIAACTGGGDKGWFGWIYNANKRPMIGSDRIEPRPPSAEAGTR